MCKVKVFASMLVYTSFHLIDIQHDPKVEGVCKNRICACIVLYAPFPLIWCATRLLSDFFALTFTPPQGSRVCVRREYVLARCSVLHYILI